MQENMNLTKEEISKEEIVAFGRAVVTAEAFGEWTQNHTSDDLRFYIMALTESSFGAGRTQGVQMTVMKLLGGEFPVGADEEGPQSPNEVN